MQGAEGQVPVRTRIGQEVEDHAVDQICPLDWSAVAGARHNRELAGRQCPGQLKRRSGTNTW
jgi:hypothetical protein